MNKESDLRYALCMEGAKAIEALQNMIGYSQDRTLLEAYKLTAMIHDVMLMIEANELAVMQRGHNAKDVMQSDSGASKEDASETEANR